MADYVIKIKKAAIIFLGAIVVLFFLQVECFAADSPVGKLTFVQGVVTIKKDGIENKIIARVGDSISSGNVLETRKNSRAQVVLTDDSVINLSSGAALRVNQYAFEKKNDRRTAIIKVLEGKARFIVYKQRSKESSFKVETSHALISAGTGDFIAEVSDKETEVAVLDGGVSVSNSFYLTVGKVWIGANQKIVVKEKTPPSGASVITSQQRRTYSKDANQF